MHSSLVCRLLLLFATFLTAGCQWSGLRNPFRDQELTTVTTPRQRIQELDALAARAEDVAAAEQATLIDQMVMQLRQEPDPLLRDRMLRALAEFSSPRAGDVLRAALADEDSDVRVTACRLLGERPGPQTTAALAETAQQDANIDVRMAAVRELGRFRDPVATRALAAALNEPDTALQRRALIAFEASVGRDFDGDVAAARQVAQQLAPPSSNPAFAPHAAELQLAEGQDSGSSY